MLLVKNIYKKIKIKIIRKKKKCIYIISIVLINYTFLLFNYWYVTFLDYF